MKLIPDWMDSMKSVRIIDFVAMFLYGIVLIILMGKRIYEKVFQGKSKQH